MLTRIHNNNIIYIRAQHARNIRVYIRETVYRLDCVDIFRPSYVVFAETVFGCRPMSIAIIARQPYSRSTESGRRQQ